MSDNRTLSGVYIGLARDWKPSGCTAERLEHIQHFVDRAAPLTTDDAAWLLKTARDAIKKIDELWSICKEMRGHLSGIISPRKGI
jgi:hypothetical protein